MLDNLTQRLARVMKTLRGEARLTEDNIADALREVRLALLEADVALPAVKAFITAVKEKAVGEEVIGSLSPGQALIGVVHRELAALMGEAHTGLNLATRRHKSGVRAFAERLDVAGDRARNVGHAACHGIPVLGGVSSHEVEDVADSLQRGRDHVEIGELLAGVVQLTFEGEAFTHGGLRDDVDVILGLDAAELAEHGGALSVLGGKARGGEVVELALVTLKPEHGAEAGGKPPERLDVGIGDGVGCGRSSGFVSHPLSLRRRADIAPDCPADVTRSAE